VNRRPAVLLGAFAVACALLPTGPAQANIAITPSPATTAASAISITAAPLPPASVPPASVPPVSVPPASVPPASVPPAAAAAASSRPANTSTPIEHLVVVMQGDRTFDNYFGSYPGVDGTPASACQPLVASQPRNGCVRPFSAHDRATPPLAAGKEVLTTQYHGGKMDAFVAAYVAQGRDGTSAMGYYDRRDLPFSWAAADHYVLFDRFFSSAFYGARANRSYWVSAAAPLEKVSATTGYGAMPTIFDRLQAAGVSWKFYVDDYDPKLTFRAATGAAPVAQTVRVPLLNIPRFPCCLKSIGPASPLRCLIQKGPPGGGS
jgi:phospholipase C